MAGSGCRIMLSVPPRRGVWATALPASKVVAAPAPTRNSRRCMIGSPVGGYEIVDAPGLVVAGLRDFARAMRVFIGGVQPMSDYEHHPRRPRESSGRSHQPSPGSLPVPDTAAHAHA